MPTSDSAMRPEPSRAEPSQPTNRWERPLRFGLVGTLNTAIDFLLLFGLVALGLHALLANTISTGVALIFSFFANRQFTFHNHDRKAAQLVKFLIITLTGLWLLQPAIIIGVQTVIGYALPSEFSLFTAKVAATIVTLLWNYLLYSRFVFRKPTVTPKGSTL